MSLTRSRISRLPGVSDLRRGLTATAAACAAVVAAAVLSGCSVQDDICGDGEYPVMTVGDTGSACVPDGEQPPKGYVRYPKDKVPQKVDDQWDRYWRTHTLDAEGNIIDAPEAG
ncbi:SCO0607 family lipoprotein [Streptomyces sp. NPDC127084]|uniref:SCO0607 family lipoprotein n=1 Tax=Streptomyces sp. NPDC127084 TaxID=3347133 RepID=UPI0036468C5E